MSAEQINELPLTKEDFGALLGELRDATRRCVQELMISKVQYLQCFTRSFPVFVSVEYSAFDWMVSICGGYEKHMPSTVLATGKSALFVDRAFDEAARELERGYYGETS